MVHDLERLAEALTRDTPEKLLAQLIAERRDYILDRLKLEGFVHIEFQGKRYRISKVNEQRSATSRA